MKRLAIFLWLLMSACAFAQVPRGVPFPQLEADAAKRLPRVTVTNAFKTEWIYDGMSRRRTRKDYTWSGSWAPTNEIHFIFDRNLVIQERDTNNIVLFSFTRGIDLSGSREGAGGIGG